MPTSTIGTASRDYSTISSWEAALGTGSQIGECYDDSAFNETLVINDADPDDITLTVASGERHDGTAGTGARIVRTGAADPLISHEVATDIVLSWLELDGGGQDIENGFFSSLNSSYNASNKRVEYVIAHDASDAGERYGLYAAGLSSGYSTSFLNNIVYDLIKSTGAGAADVYGIGTNIGTLTGKTVYIHNNTIHNCTNDGGGSGGCIGIKIGTAAGSENNIKNNVVTGTNGDTSGTIADFDSTIAGDTTNVSNNASSDTSAPGASSLTSITTANQYVSTTGGSEDFHIQDVDADIFEAGADLGTTPTGVNIDADGYDRDAGGELWSIGAFDGDELRVAGGSVIPVFMRSYRQRRLLV